MTPKPNYAVLSSGKLHKCRPQEMTFKRHDGSIGYYVTGETLCGRSVRLSHPGKNGNLITSHTIFKEEPTGYEWCKTCKRLMEAQLWPA